MLSLSDTKTKVWNGSHKADFLRWIHTKEKRANCWINLCLSRSWSRRYIFCHSLAASLRWRHFTKREYICFGWTCIIFLIFANPLQDGSFYGLLADRGRGIVGQNGPHFPKSHIWWKLSVLPYLKKIQRMYKSRDTSLKFCWHFFFFSMILYIHDMND